MPFTPQTLNAFTMTGRIAAAELPACHPSHRQFIAVYPPRGTTSEWTVRRFAVLAEWLRCGYDISEEEMAGLTVVRLPDLAAVERLLDEWGIDPVLFDAPWKTDAPI